MKRFLLVLSLLAPAVLVAQTAVPTAGGTVATAPAGATPTAQDPLGRSTPRGSILGFIRFAQAGNYKQAIQYLQLSTLERNEHAQDLAKQLKVVLDEGFVGSLLQLSDQPEGKPQADLPLDRERAGRLIVGDLEADLLLSRVREPNGDIWLISHDTLERVPDLYSEIRTEQFESKLPAPLVNYSFLGILLWQWLAILVLVPLCYLLAWALSHFSLRILSRRKLSIFGMDIGIGADFVLPISLLLGCTLARIMVAQLHFSLLGRFYYFRVLSIIFIISVVWLAWRLIVRAAEAWRFRAVTKGDLGTGSLLILGQRIAKVCLAILLVLAIFKALGFDMTAIVAGLGIGGVAIAFGAQKSLENLLGGISLLSDEAIHVGDLCRFENTTGRVEDISLRSTRIRTAERSELSIPNGLLSTMTIENLSRRDKMLIQTTLRIRQDIPHEQLNRLLAAMRTMLSDHPRIESETVRVRWTEISDSAFNIEIFCYAKTILIPEFFEIREDCFMKLLEVVSAVGATLAYPSTAVYLESANSEAKKSPPAEMEAGEEPKETSTFRRKTAT